MKPIKYQDEEQEELEDEEDEEDVEQEEDTFSNKDRSNK